MPCGMQSSGSAVALILAGGKASRMGGGDKPLLDVGGSSMLGRVIAALRSDAAAIAISANGDPARFAAFALPVLPDGTFEGEGPLAGLLAGLDWAAALHATSLLTVPGDTPLVPSGLANALAPPPACVATGDRAHHLVLRRIYHRSIASRDLHVDRRIEGFPDFKAGKPRGERPGGPGHQPRIDRR